MTVTTCPRVFVETIGEVTVASLADADIVAEEVIREVDEQLTGLLDGRGPVQVLLNFREVRSMSSTMLAVLLKFGRRVAGEQGRMKLCCIAPHLFEVFKITRFDRLFEIHDEEMQALDAF